MNRIFIMMLTSLISLPALANHRCGLGSKIFGHNKKIVSQTFENITNRAASGLPSIAFGTSGCKNDGTLIFDPVGRKQKEGEQLQYANANFEELKLEMASGRGEVLDAFAETLGCTREANVSFGSTTRASYSTIMNNENLEPEQMLNNVRRAVQKSEVLRSQCDAV